MHVFVFWGKDIMKTYRSARKGEFNDKHHDHMAKNYKEVPWYWYAAILVISFILGIVVVAKEHITLPIWGYIVALLLGSFIAPLVSWTRRTRWTVLTGNRVPSSTPNLETVSRPTTCPR